MFNKMAKSIENALRKSSKKDVLFLYKDGKYDVVEYGDSIEGEFDNWQTTVINFNYSNEELPTLEGIEKVLYDVFSKERHKKGV